MLANTPLCIVVWKTAGHEPTASSTLLVCSHEPTPPQRNREPTQVGEEPSRVLTKRFAMDVSKESVTALGGKKLGAGGQVSLPLNGLTKVKTHTPS